MLRDGKIIFSGKDEELKNSEDAFIRRFLRGR
jgi:ABC-type transporter Mla maintaining outer membrane lipid asymmetry ATPase subunit MlaF